MDTGILPGAFALMLALYQSRFGWANVGDFGSWVGGPACATYNAVTFRQWRKRRSLCRSWKRS